MLRLDALPDDAHLIADNLVTSNLRGIDSHGVGQLKLYVSGVQSGFIVPRAHPEIIKENSSLAKVDANNGFGQVSGAFSMKLAIKKAIESGIGVVTTSHSNHYGFAAYYAMMALEQDLLGITMTNSPPLLLPTFGKNAMLGSNPIAMAVPCGQDQSWVLDMATSVVPLSKIDLFSRRNEQLPNGWATDENGATTNDPLQVVRNLPGHDIKGGIHPLGGEGELYGGHKGYGLSMMVDILSGILSSANYGPDVSFFSNGQFQFANIGHFFMAIDPSFFMAIDEFTGRLDDLIARLHNSEKALSQTRIYVHGEKEAEEYKRRVKEGVPLDEATVANLKQYSRDFGVDLKLE